MKYNYHYKIIFGLNEPFDINYVENVCNKYPNAKILVEVQNTRGISSSMIKQLNPNVAIRIAGGYDEERIKRNKNKNFGNGETGQYYIDAVIYTRNEIIKILEEIEKIESGISKKWSDFQKFLYVYDRLKRGIMYDPKYEQKSSDEVRSLRNLITKKTVCAGYAMTFKELMDRNNIYCEYVEGGTKSSLDVNHAWNIVGIDGKKYAIDLTWDNAKFRSGKFNDFDYIGQDIVTFSQSHYPAKGEKTQDYKHTLSQIDSKLIKNMHSQMRISKSRDYSSTTYYGTRKDGSEYIVVQLADAIINNTQYYRYYYVDISNDGKKQLPLILYSETNVTHLIDCKNFKRPIPPHYEAAIDNILFSRENIDDSLLKKTYYIGKVRKSNIGNKLELVSSYKEISKPDEKNNLFTYPTKRFGRSDGTVFIAQQMTKTPKLLNGVYILAYDIFEMINDNGKEVLKRNTVYTERNFFLDNRQSMIDDYLSRERLDRKVYEAGGYIGYYDENGISTYNPNLVKLFETSKRIDLEDLIKQSQKK